MAAWAEGLIARGKFELCCQCQTDWSEATIRMIAGDDGLIAMIGTALPPG